MGLSRKFYGLTLIVTGISTLTFTAPTFGVASLSCATILYGVAILFTS